MYNKMLIKIKRNSVKNINTYQPVDQNQLCSNSMEKIGKFFSVKQTISCHIILDVICNDL